MARLPVQGSDENIWGNILNDFLSVELNSDGTLKKSAEINAAIPKTLATTKGDMLVASAASTIARLGVGSNGQQLVADSSQSLGVKWSTVSAAFVYATDYGAVFDGSTDDSTALQSAITAAISAGKPLFLAPGTAMVGTSLSIGSPITIIGSGREATTLKAVNGLDDYVISFTGGSVGVGIVGAHLADFKIDGNSSNQTAGGGILANGAVQCSFERVHLTSCYNWGLALGQITGGAFGHHNRIFDCLFDQGTASAGYGGGATASSSDENWFVATDFEFLGGSANPVGSTPVMLYDAAGLQYVLGCNFVSGGNNCIGVRVQDTKGTKITNCIFDGVGGDGVFVASNKCVIAGNVFTGVGDSGSSAASAIHLEFNTHYNVVANNSLETSTTTNKTRSLIREEGTGGSGDNIIEANAMSQNASPTVANLETGGSGTIVRNNIGWTTESSGTATVANGSTSIAVNHGLSFTPGAANVSVTPTNNLGSAAKFWVSGFGATQFTINVDADPGVTTATFAWRAGN